MSDLGEKVVGYIQGLVYEFPDGFEVVLQSRFAAVEGYTWRTNRPKKDLQVKSIARSRSVVTRYCRFNALSELWTLTYSDAELPEDRSLVGEQLRYFLKKFRRTGRDPGAYVCVEEFGELTNRLHLHMGGSWSRKFGAVEVCDRCAVDGLRAVRDDIPAAGSFCIGCLWSHGFVGRPDEIGGDSLSLAHYLAKYLVADFSTGWAQAFGHQRYRVAQGYKVPAPMRFEAGSVDDAKRVVAGLMDGELVEWWSNEGQDGPLTLVGSLNTGALG